MFLKLSFDFRFLVYMDGEWEIGDFAISIGKSLKYGFFLPSSFIFSSPLSRLLVPSAFEVKQLPFSFPTVADFLSSISTSL